MTRPDFKLLAPLFGVLLAMAGNPLLAAPGAEPIVVESADPNEAEQGQELDVLIRGSGFGKDAKVKYLVAETDDDSQIDVLSVEFVDESTLRTRIRVKDDALVTNYDVQVQRGRRKGKGTTFAVIPLQTPNDGLIEIVSSGAVSVQEVCIEPVNDPRTTVGCNGNDGNLVTITLGQFFIDFSDYDKGALGSACFADGPEFVGTIQLRNDFGGDGDDAIFRFRALNSDGTVDVQYALISTDPHLGGWSDPPGFPPALGETTTLVGTHWSLSSYSRDKKYGPCSSEGELNGGDIVTVDLTRLF